MLICPNCNGEGSIGEGGGFIEEGERPATSFTCKECNGIGEIPPRFFVEFIFDYDLTGRKYWLPLYLKANSPEEADKIVQKTQKGLEEQFFNIDHSKPVPETELRKPYIQERYDLHKHQKVVKLEVDQWKFKDIADNPDSSFNEHFKYIAAEGPLEPKTIANRVKAQEFSVRVIQEGDLKQEFDEFLLINVVTE